MTLLVGICLSACTDYGDDVDIRHSDVENGAYIKLKIDVASEAFTRAYDRPHGGEMGDGTEDGIRHENELKNLMVFIIRAEQGMDADGGTSFLYKGFMQEGDAGWESKTYGVDITFQTGSYEPQNDDRVLIVANAGNQTSAINTLQSLRDRTEYSAWTNGASLSDNHLFVMTSAYNDGSEVGKVNVVSHNGSQADPYLSTLHIQRTAARIDFMYHETDNYNSSTPNELFYNVKNSTGAELVATVHLDHIIPVNLMQQSSYLIKRVTTDDNIGSTIKYGALETATTSFVPTNYVIEPHTLTKQSTVDETSLNNWYGSTRAKTVFASPTTYATEATGISTYMSTSISRSELSYFDKAMTLAYTNENTQSKEKHSKDFITGLLLKTVYEPKTVYSNGNLEIATYTKGTTFWRYTPTKAVMKEEDSKYFISSEAATAYRDAHKDDLATITEYPGGVCYYNIWLRHANIDSDPHETFPMEYGIVRNNIYRVGVEKFTGPGSPTPSYEDPTHVRLRIFVRPWNLRVHPEILL